MSDSFFIVLEPDKCPRVGFPIGEVETSLREWKAANPAAEILVVSCPYGEFPKPGTVWVDTAESFLWVDEELANEH